MTSHFICAMTFLITCGKCTQQHEEKLILWTHGEIPLPSLPDGWHTFDGLPICPRHRLVVQEDEDTGEVVRPLLVSPEVKAAMDQRLDAIIAAGPSMEFP